MTRVLVLGASGMFGHKAMQRLALKFETTGAVRLRTPVLAKLASASGARILDGFDAADASSLTRALSAVRPDVVINGVGVIKQLSDAADDSVADHINGVF